MSKSSSGCEIGWYVIQSFEMPFGLQRIWSRDQVHTPMNFSTCYLFLYLSLQFCLFDNNKRILLI